jgi:POT family proton-dependent oligopeptide transporter
MSSNVSTPAGMAWPRQRRSFFGHPRGLGYIVFAEAWERFSFFGMQALLVLYMVEHLLQPGVIEGVAGFAAFRAGIEGLFGAMSTQALATQIFGLYVGFVYFAPVVGGLLGDRLIGRRKAVLSGAVLMAFGHFMMALEAAFLPALGSLIVGSGLLKGNLAAQVGELYVRDDPRRDPAFSLYCMAINTGACIAPLVCGTLGEVYGWHYGFGAAGIGMLIGIAIYVAGRAYLPADARTIRTAAPARLRPGDWRIIAALTGLIVLMSLFWTGQTQIWNTYPLWLRDRVARELFDLAVPVTWFQSLDTFAVISLAPLVIWYWQRQARASGRPRDLDRVATGCVVFAAACVWLSVGEATAQAGKLGLVWPVVFHFVSALAYLYAGPPMLALLSRAAPAAVNAMMVGGYYLSYFIGGIASGWLGRYYETQSPAVFWFMHAAIVACGALLILLLRRPLANVLDAKTHAAAASHASPQPATLPSTHPSI